MITRSSKEKAKETGETPLERGTVATRPTIMNEVREGVRIGSLRRETEGIKKWNQVFDDPVLASKCMDSTFDDSLVAREALASPLERIIYSL